MKSLSKIATLIIFISFTLFSSGQYLGISKIDDSNVSPWETEVKTSYQNVYHFGYSEGESDLLLLILPDKVIAQIRYGEWNDDATAWLNYYRNLTNVSIKDNLFYSDQTNGEFVGYDRDEEHILGLEVYNPWSGVAGEEQYEIGPLSYKVEKYFSGKFIQASLRHLTKSELSAMSKIDLKIMRNEIFARYGYIFIKGGAMDQYFSKQSWYRPQHKDVTNFLTELEKENIELIQEMESR